MGASATVTLALYFTPRREFSCGLGGRTSGLIISEIDGLVVVDRTRSAIRSCSVPGWTISVVGAENTCGSQDASSCGGVVDNRIGSAIGGEFRCWRLDRDYDKGD